MNWFSFWLGSFETMGTGMDMDLNSIAFKSNFAFMDDSSSIVVKRRVDRTFPEWGVPLCEALNSLKLADYPEYEVSCLHATEHRCAVKVAGQDLSADITGTDPLKDNKALLKVEALHAKDAKASFTAGLVNALSDGIRECLREHPINVERREKGQTWSNVVLLRGAGQRLDVETFQQKHLMKPFMVAPTAVIAGKFGYL